MVEKYKEFIWDQGAVNRFWDWQSQFPENYFTYQFGKEIVEQLSGYIVGENVMDYGCGVGNLLPHLCNFSSSIYAADASAESLSLVSNKMKKYSNFKGVFEIDQVAKSGKKFDTILVVEVIEHLYDQYLNEMIDNLKLILNEGGRVIFTTPNNEDLSKSMMICPESGKIFHKWQHVRSWNKVSLPKYLTDRGFEVENVSETSFAREKLSGPKSVLKSLMRYFVHGRLATPHLYCVAKISNSAAMKD